MGTVYHIYQRTPKRFVIFYSISDFLVFLMTVCVTARKTRTRVLGVCCMFDHVHLLAEADSPEALSGFVDEYSSRFARQYNEDKACRGAVFEPRFGRAAKWGGKKIRTAIAYLYNNPVERMLCKNAEEYQWNFLAYAFSGTPFSVDDPLRSLSYRARSAASEIKYCRQHDKIISYAHLSKIFDSVNKTERKFLVDYIVSSYKCIDYTVLSSYFDGPKNMMTAIHSNTGSEYEIREEQDKVDDRYYQKFLSVLITSGHISNSKEIFHLEPKRKLELISFLNHRFPMVQKQVYKFIRYIPGGSANSGAPRRSV